MTRISFDLDDVLVCVGAPVDDALAAPWPLALWRRWRFRERLRRGTRELLRELIARGCEVWVYTTSDRPAGYVRAWFRAHGVALADVVNRARHVAIAGRTGPSKLPSAFGVDLHVDDSEGVRIEGERHGFRVLVVSPDDPDWTLRVTAAVDALLAERRAARALD